MERPENKSHSALPARFTLVSGIMGECPTALRPKRSLTPWAIKQKMAGFKWTATAWARNISAGNAILFTDKVRREMSSFASGRTCAFGMKETSDRNSGRKKLDQ